MYWTCSPQFLNNERSSFFKVPFFPSFCFMFCLSLLSLPSFLMAYRFATFLRRKVCQGNICWMWGQRLHGSFAESRTHLMQHGDWRWEPFRRLKTMTLACDKAFKTTETSSLVLPHSDFKLKVGSGHLNLKCSLPLSGQTRTAEKCTC